MLGEEALEVLKFILGGEDYRYNKNLKDSFGSLHKPEQDTLKVFLRTYTTIRDILRYGAKIKIVKDTRNQRYWVFLDTLNGRMIKMVRDPVLSETLKKKIIGNIAIIKFEEPERIIEIKPYSATSEEILEITEKVTGIPRKIVNNYLDFIKKYINRGWLHWGIFEYARIAQELFGEDWRYVIKGRLEKLIKDLKNGDFEDITFIDEKFIEEMLNYFGEKGEYSEGLEYIRRIKRAIEEGLPIYIRRTLSGRDLYSISRLRTLADNDFVPLTEEEAREITIKALRNWEKYFEETGDTKGIGWLKYIFEDFGIEDHYRKRIISKVKRKIEEKMLRGELSLEEESFLRDFGFN